MILTTIFAVFVAIAVGALQGNLAQNHVGVPPNGELKQIYPSQGIFCEIDSQSVISCEVAELDSSTTAWTVIASPAGATPLQVAVYGREMVLLDTRFSIYRAYFNGRTTAWTRITGSLKQISIDGSQMCGCNQLDEIYCANYNRYSLCFPTQCDPNNTPARNHFDPTVVWVKIPGSLRQLTVRAGRLFGVNSKHEVFFRPSYGTTGWVQLPGSLSHIAYDFDHNRLCGRTFTLQVYCATQNLTTKPNWSLVPGASVTSLEIWGNRIFGVDSRRMFVFTYQF